MTRKLLLAAALLTFSFAQAQISPKNGSWVYLDITHQSMLNPIEDFEQKWYGIGAQYSVMGEWTFADPLALGFGLGVSVETYQNNMQIVSAPSGREIYTLRSEDDYESISQSAAYLSLPLELRYISDANEKDRRWSVHVGAKVGVRLSGNGHFDDDQVEVTYEKIDEMERFRTDVYLRVGYGRFGVLFGYALTPFYSEQRVVGLEPLTVADGTLDQMRPLTAGIYFAL